MKTVGRPSVCLSRRSSAAAACGGFAAEHPAGRRYLDRSSASEVTTLYRYTNLFIIIIIIMIDSAWKSSPATAARRSAGNAGSVVLTAKARG